MTHFRCFLCGPRAAGVGEGESGWDAGSDPRGFLCSFASKPRADPCRNAAEDARLRAPRWKRARVQLQPLCPALLPFPSPRERSPARLRPGHLSPRRFRRAALARAPREGRRPGWGLEQRHLKIVMQLGASAFPSRGVQLRAVAWTELLGCRFMFPFSRSSWSASCVHGLF